MLRKALTVAAILLLSLSANAQKAILEAFDPVTDSLTVLAKEHFRVRSYLKLNKAMKRGQILDLYFTKELGDYPWRSGDPQWFRQQLRALWPEEVKQYTLGGIWCESVDLAELAQPEPGNNGQPKDYRFKVKAPARTLFIEETGAHKADRGLRGRNIALWQSHGRYYDNGAGCWSWQRSPNWRTTEDLYTQSYVLPFLIPMLERAGAYVVTPRERDTNSTEVVIDNDRSFRSPGFPVRTHGSYKEKGAWKDAGEGFADKKEVYVKEDNPFTLGTARQASCISGKGNASIRWNPELEENGRYCIYISYKTLPNSTRSAHYTVEHRGGRSEFTVNQKMGGGTWIFLGEFELGPDSYVMLDNGTPSGRTLEKGSVVTADAVRIGGGIGKIARGKGKDTSEWETSGLPCYLEGAMYSEQWAGMPYDRIHQWSTDYTCDYASRGEWVKMMKDDLGLPIDLSLAFHTDAGVTPNDSIVGTLSIYTLKADGKRKFENGGDRAACRLLTDWVQTQIVNDLRADYDSLWTRRQTWNRSYSESRTTDVPGVLLELLSHQNFSDMKFGLDPQFRFDACRAIYKGMLKFLSSYYGESYVVAPLPVKDFSATFGDDGYVVLNWKPTEDEKEPTATPSEYIIYTRKDDGAFDKGLRVSECHLSLPIEDGHLYSFMVEACNRGGRSFPSEILSIGQVSANARKVLIVNNFDRISAPSWFDSEKYAGFDARLDSGVPYMKDISYGGESWEYRRDKKYINNTAPGFGATDIDMAGFQPGGNTFDYPAVHGKALMDLGYSFCSMSRSAFEKAPAEQYFTLDVICGKQISTLVGNARGGVRFRVFPAGLRKALRASASAGCNILISGAYIATDAWDEIYPIKDDGYQQDARDFIQNVLGYRWSTTRGSVNGKVTMDGQNFSFRNELNEDSYCVETAGGIRPSSGGTTIAKYTNRLGAGVYHPFEGYGVVAWSFPLELLSSKEELKTILDKSLKYF
ncbi:MAG: xanthan lyase [Bacteroidales bacterium]|nr:xanthan lyase [Bacteroidales bacterium]